MQTSLWRAPEQLEKLQAEIKLSLTAIVAAAYLLVVMLAIAAAGRAVLRIDPVLALRAE